MYDLVRIARAVATNQVARVAPSAYVRMTRQTGRGDGDRESPAEVAAYFRRCVADYVERLGGAGADAERCFAGKVVLEYGPGDLPGVAALLVSLGAEKVYCVDRFPMVRGSDKSERVMRELIEHCTPHQRRRLIEALADPAHPSDGFASHRVEYLVTPHGLSGLDGAVDVVLSRAVMEHVDDLDATFADMVRALRTGATAIHQVDLKSHGLHRVNPLDFLECPGWLWQAMFSHKGVPNRWRVDRYRDILAAHPVRLVSLEPTQLAGAGDIEAVRPRLAPSFRDVSDDDLAWLGFWLVFTRT